MDRFRLRNGYADAYKTIRETMWEGFATRRSAHTVIDALYSPLQRALQTPVDNTHYPGDVDLAAGVDLEDPIEVAREPG
jgi:hypothetical protein